MQPSSLVRGFRGPRCLGHHPDRGNTRGRLCGRGKEHDGGGAVETGFVEEKREKFTLPGRNGVLISGHQEADGKTLRKWLLLAAMPKLTALVAVQAPDAENAL